MSAKLKIGITGATGNVATTLREALAEEYDLTGFALEETDFSQAVDLSRPEQLAGKFDGLNIVIHLAAQINAIAPWEEILPNNIVATYNVFEECRRAGVKKIIFATTNHTQHGYFMGNNSPMITDPEKCTYQVKITDPPAPDSLYGVSKLFGEDLGRYFSRIHGIQFVGLRIGWTEQHDDPTVPRGTDQEFHMQVLYLSKRDCVQAFRKAITTDKQFVLGYAVSDNQHGIFDLEETTAQLGYKPQDSADVE